MYVERGEIKFAFRVIKDSQICNLLREPPPVAFGIAVCNACEHDEPALDFADDFIFDPDGSVIYSLDECAHGKTK